MAKNIYTVAQVNSYIRNMFTQDFMLNAISVRGEVSNCKYHGSGHIYFTLKDGGGAIACVMFAGNRSGLAFRMQEGQKVVVTGTIDVYERDGKYQLYARQISLDGEGDLYTRFIQLKEELAEMGMFAPEYKQPIPKYIRTLGVVTASTGAAIRDIINITKRRNPYVQIILYPAIVQGEQAAASIVNGIRALEQLQVDVMIVGRGGGSAEDLWAFNEREVAQAVFDCMVPVISAVGHETDTTIIDFVSDLRAPTPSAAAELAVYEQSVLDAQLAGAADTLQRRLRHVIEKKRLLLGQYRVRLQKASPIHRVHEQQNRLISLEDHLTGAMTDRLRRTRHRLELYIEKFKGLSPLGKLNQGYAYVADSRGHRLGSIEQIKPQDGLSVYVADGVVEARAVSVRRSMYAGGREQEDGGIRQEDGAV